MSILPEEAKEYIGLTLEAQFACDSVEPGAVRRFVHAIMDDDPMFWQDGEPSARYGGPVAPPLFPTAMFRRGFDEPDLLQERARDPDFDGATNSMQGLPEIKPLRGMGVLNGGSEIEIYRYAGWGERVKVISRYEDIFEKQTSKGPIILIVIVSEYFNQDDELLLRVRRTSLRRPV